MTTRPDRRAFACFLALSLFGLVAIAANPSADQQFVYYQDKLLGRESGVYEDGDSVFVLARIAVLPENRLRLEGAAMLEFSAQLRRWALEQTRRDRGDEPPRSAVVVRMAAFNDETDPDWRFPPWRVSVGGRQFPSRETGGFFVQGQVYSKEALLKAIPESYRRHPTDAEVFAAFARNAAAAARKDRKAFAAKCGFFEFPLLGSQDAAAFPSPEGRSFPSDLESFLVKSRTADAGKAGKEWKRVNQALAEGVRKSPVCASYLQGRAVTNVVVSETTVTNAVVSETVATNAVVSVPDGDGTTAAATNFVVSVGTVTNFVAETVSVTNRTVSFVRDDSDRSLLAAGLLRPAPGPLAFVPSLPAANASADEIRASLRRAPKDPRLWKALAARYGADGDPALSLSCLLNALSMTPSDTDIVAEIALRYDALGCPELARGAALFAFGTAKDEVVRAKVLHILKK